jgi:hypothetical protein
MTTENEQSKNTQDFQNFDSVAGKLFQVPIGEIREMEKKEDVKRGEGKKAPSPDELTKQS